MTAATEYRFAHWVERVEMRPFAEVVADLDSSQCVMNSRSAAFDDVHNETAALHGNVAHWSV